MLEKRRYDIDLGIKRENLVFIYSIPSRDVIVHFFFLNLKLNDFIVSRSLRCDSQRGNKCSQLFLRVSVLHFVRSFPRTTVNQTGVNQITYNRRVKSSRKVKTDVG